MPAIDTRAVARTPHLWIQSGDQLAIVALLVLAALGVCACASDPARVRAPIPRILDSFEEVDLAIDAQVRLGESWRHLGSLGDHTMWFVQRHISEPDTGHRSVVVAMINAAWRESHPDERSVKMRVVLDCARNLQGISAMAFFESLIPDGRAVRVVTFPSSEIRLVAPDPGTIGEQIHDLACNEPLALPDHFWPS